MENAVALSQSKADNLSLDPQAAEVKFAAHSSSSMPGASLPLSCNTATPAPHVTGQLKVGSDGSVSETVLRSSLQELGSLRNDIAGMEAVLTAVKGTQPCPTHRLRICMMILSSLA